ncbi:MAG: Nif3-like dinuclear metal center hexameric protein [Bacteroidota bacterium]
MLVQDIASVLESWAPLPAAESYDNVGLLVGRPDWEVSGIMINLDMTEAVVEEARAKGCNMLVTHHPIWFSGRKRLIGDDYVSRTIMKAIKEDIALYACHTNLDNIRTGVNQRIADLIGLEKTAFLQPKSQPVEENELGSGMIGELPEALEVPAFLRLIKERFRCGGIRYAEGTGEPIKKVAVCGGSGSFLTRTALKQGADAFVTADITYHKFFDQEESMLLLDIGHYESEQFTSQLIHEFLSEKFPNFAIRLSETYTNPVRYF